MNKKFTLLRQVVIVIVICVAVLGVARLLSGELHEDEREACEKIDAVLIVSRDGGDFCIDKRVVMDAD